MPIKKRNYKRRAIYIEGIDGGFRTYFSSASPDIAKRQIKRIREKLSFKKRKEQ